MISNLELKQFRGLEHVEFGNLGRANLIIGGNNTGKTSILEALVLLHGHRPHYQNLPRTFREQPQGDTSDDHGFWKMLLREGKILEFKLSADASTIAGVTTKTESPYPGHQHEFCRSNGSGNDQSSFTLDALHGETIPFQITPHTLSVLSTKQMPPESISELFNQIAPLNLRWSCPGNGENGNSFPLRNSSAVFHGRTAGIRSWMKSTDGAAAVVIME